MEVFGAQGQSREWGFQAESLLGPCPAPVWAGPLQSQGGGLGSALPPPREGPCGIQSLRALDTPLLFQGLLKPEFMTPDSVGLPTPLCEFGPCTPFKLSTLAPPQLPGSFASRKLGQVLQSGGSVASGRLALSADQLLRGGVGTGGGKTRG